MTPAGYSGTPLPRKLGIKDGHRVATLAAPGNFTTTLGRLPAGARLAADPGEPESPEDASTGGRSFDVVIAFVLTHEELERRLRHGRRLLDWDGGLWLAWPKRSSTLAGELRESDVRAGGLATGLVDNKICAIDADWSGLRFVHRREHRPRRR